MAAKHAALQKLWNIDEQTDETILSMYCMQSFHKSGLQLMFIFDTNNFFYHCVAKWLNGSLEPIRMEIVH